MMDFGKTWVEVIFVILVVVGFVFSLAAPSAVLSYLIIFIAGFMGGRLIYVRRKSMAGPYVIIGVGFLFGFLLGSRFGDWIVIIIMFGLGTWLSYYLHDKGYVKDWKIWP